MKNFTANLVVKTTAFILLIVTVTIMAASFSAGVYMYEKGFYSYSEQNIKNQYFRRLTYSYSHQAFKHYYYIVQPNLKDILQDAETQQLKKENFGFLNEKNFDFLVKNDQGRVVFDTRPEQAQYQFQETNDFYVPLLTESEEAENPDEQEKLTEAAYAGDPVLSEAVLAEEPAELHFTVTGFVNSQLIHKDEFFLTDKLVSIGYSLKNTIIILFFVSLLLSVILFVYLMISAGRRRNSDLIKDRTFDRIPFDLVLFGYLLIVLLLVYSLGYSYDYLTFILGASFTVLVFLPLTLLLSMSFSVRIKQGRLLKNTLIFRIGHWCWSVVRKAFSLIWHLLGSLPIVWKTAAALLVWFLLELLGIIATAYSPDLTLTFWLVSRIFAAAVLTAIAISLKTLQKGGQKIAEGDVEHKIDTKYMLRDFRGHAQTLNNIGMGMARAVSERLKSERFKTELITNVSHDIKTPLTSIINYVDLVKKEETDNPKITEYIEVIDRHSNRLKKLTEDLVEASKATTGNLQVNLEPCEINVLLDQAAGEYGDKLAENELKLVISKPETPVMIMADGRMLWRVLDNLMNNVCKYAQTKTRVYFDLEQAGKQAVITLKNISAYELNITGGEMMERFVRGDISRNTEGSGLGLSIARSLTELQGGRFNILIDGDLFKAQAVFPIIQPADS